MEVPIGTIVAWAKTLTGTPTLPTNWVECNGQTLSDGSSVYNGQTMPTMNTANRFVRGSDETTGTTGGASSHTHTLSSASTTIDSIAQVPVLTAGTTGTSSNAPVFYDVVWIIKVK